MVEHLKIFSIYKKPIKESIAATVMRPNVKFSTILRSLRLFFTDDDFLLNLTTLIASSKRVVMVIKNIDEALVTLKKTLTFASAAPRFSSLLDPSR